MNAIEQLKAYVKMDARRQWLPAFKAFRYAFEDSQSAEKVSHKVGIEEALQGGYRWPPSSSPGRPWPPRMGSRTRKGILRYSAW